ncbi:MAG TPA: hypothetical protein VGP72_24765 [Planctomycetota bacterium]
MRIALALLAGLTALACCGEVDTSDTQTSFIVMAGQARAVTKIVQDDYLYVVGALKNGAQLKVAACAVDEVLYAGREGNFIAARERRAEERHSLAALYWVKALEALEKQLWGIEQCSFGAGEALCSAKMYKGFAGRRGQKIAPSVYLRETMEANPKSRFLPQVWPLLVESLTGEERLDEAAAALARAQAWLKQYREETLRIGEGFTPIYERARARLALAGARLANRKLAPGTPEVAPPNTRNLAREEK